MASNRKGTSLSIEIVAIIAVVLFVLVVVAGFFFGGFGRSAKGIVDISKGGEEGAAESDTAGNIKSIKTVFGCWYCVKTLACSDFETQDNCPYGCTWNSNSGACEGSATFYQKYVSSTGKTFRGYGDKATCNTNDKELYDGSECDKIQGHSCQCI